MLWSPVAGIRWSTLLLAIAMFLGVGIVRRRPLHAIAAVVAWTATFETIFHVVGIVGYHWPAANIAWETAALAGWIILAAVLGIWPDWRFALLFVFVMALWIASGFHYNVPGQTAPIDIRSEVLNEAAKSALGMAYLVGALRVQPLGSRRLPRPRVCL